jgi:ketosteroid isomerase-like protein
VLLAIPATVVAQTGTDDTKTMQHAADQWMAAYNAGDATAVAKMYTEDARLSTAMGTADGRPAIGQYLKNEMAAVVKMQNITVDKSQRFSDVDYSQGTFTVTGPAGQITGHWLTFGKCSGDVCPIESHNLERAAATTKVSIPIKSYRLSYSCPGKR